MLNLTTKMYKKVLKSDIENFRRVIVSGSPGIGKSAILKGLQSVKGETKLILDTKLSPEWEVIEERIYNRGEFAAGIPTIIDTPDGETTAWTIPEWMLKIKDAQAKGKKVVLLLDDFHLLVEELQKIFYQFLESFSINGFSVEPCAIVLLGNYNVEELSMKATIESPIMGRMDAFYQLQPDFEEWMQHVDIHQKILVYLAQNKKDFYTENPENTTMYPSPRTWEKASRIMEKGHPLGKNILMAVLGEKVGGDIAAQWDSLGMTLEEMLTPASNVLENAIKAMLLSKEANLEKGDRNFLNILEILDTKFTEELASNFFVTTLRKFQQDEKTAYFHEEVIMEITAAINQKGKVTLPKGIKQNEFDLLKKYIEVILEAHKFNKK